MTLTAKQLAYFKAAKARAEKRLAKKLRAMELARLAGRAA